MSQKLAQYITDNNIAAKHIICQQSTHTVADAAKTIGASADNFVKNICMIDEKGRFITVIVRGNDKVDKNAVGAYLGVGKPRIATPQEVTDTTGYKIGGVPSFGYNALFLIDTKVMHMDIVYSGGGDANSLVAISPQTIQTLTNAYIDHFRVHT